MRAKPGVARNFQPVAGRGRVKLSYEGGKRDLSLKEEREFPIDIYDGSAVESLGEKAKRTSGLIRSTYVPDRGHQPHVPLPPPSPKKIHTRVTVTHTP